MHDVIFAVQPAAVARSNRRNGAVTRISERRSRCTPALALDIDAGG
jgi:hypothetical protein